MLISAILSFSFLTACASCSKGEENNEAMNVSTLSSSETDTTTIADVPTLLYMGQASIRITTEEGRVIYIDPYAGNGYDLAADLILVTREHFDHNARIVIAQFYPSQDGVRTACAKSGME